MVVIYFPCVSVSVGQSELQCLQFPSGLFSFAIFCSYFLFLAGGVFSSKFQAKLPYDKHVK